MMQPPHTQPSGYQGMTRQQAAEMLRLQRRTGRLVGCLSFVVFTWFFGLFYWSWLALKWTALGAWWLARLTWNWLVAYPLRWTWLGIEWSWRQTVRSMQVLIPLAVAAFAFVQARIGQRRGQLPPGPPRG